MQKRDIIKYVGIILIVIGIIIVFKNLITVGNSEKFKETKSKDKLYSVTINLQDEDTKEILSGAELGIYDKNDKLVKKFKTTSKIKKVKNLKPGIYTLKEITTPENYKQADPISFEITSSSIELIMQNSQLTEEESREMNTTSNEIEVDNTLSNKSIFTTIISLSLIISGLYLLKSKLLSE